MDDSGLGRVVRRQAALLQLARMDLSDYASALRMIAEVDARLLGVERVSIWRFTPDHRHATCEELYTLRKGRHERGPRLDVADFPRYFAALEDGRVIAANDARNDPRTQELAKEQLDALGITSTLDVPIRYYGTIVGFLSHEHVGPARTWTQDDIAFADSAAGILAMCREVAERRRVEEALRDERNFVSTVLDTAGSLVLVLNATGEIIRANRACRDLLGHSEEDLVGQPFSKALLRPDDAALVDKALERFRNTGAMDPFENPWVAKDQTTRRISWAGTVIPDLEGAPRNLVITGVDITERKALEDQLIHDAFHDALTGLPNRALFMDRLGQSLRQLKRQPEFLFAVLQIDLDRFKIVNDGLGHTVGDRLLVDFCRRLESCLRPGDTMARLGGDEFGVILEDLGDGAQVATVAERFQERLRAPFRVDGQEIFTSASIGIALSLTGYERPEDMMRDADTALHRAKSRGGARHEVFDQEMHDRALARLRMETDLRRALDRGEFTVNYQPVVSLADGKIRGFEALVRWNHPTRGRVSPLEFIQPSEETGLIIAIDRWVLREASRQLKDWHERIPESRDLTVSVNLSGKQFTQPDIAEYVVETLRETGLQGNRLGLEITESVLMECSEKTNQVLWDLRQSGAKLFLDDFGTGYSSLGYLHRFPIDSLKIDRSFVSGMRPDGEGREIVKTIISLARNLDLKVVAEGVETPEQQAALKEMKCEYAQGYAFSKPVSGEEAELLIAGAAGW